MTQKEIMQQKEIERLQKKIRKLTEAYSGTVEELNQMKHASAEKRRGRPPVDELKRARILALCQQGKTMRQIAKEVDAAVGTVHKIISQAAEKSRTIYVYMDREEPSTVIDTYPAVRKVKIFNLTDDMISRAFGVRETPSWEDFEEFLESRCMPRTRYGIREELKYMGIDVYDPFQIVGVTDGRVYGDYQWIKTMDQSFAAKYDAAMKAAEGKEAKKQALLGLLKEEGQERI